MALIKCPECGKEVSDQAPFCIHCGYPIEKMAINKCPKCGKEVPDQAKFCTYCGHPLKQQITSGGGNSVNPPSSNIPRCPTCGSANVEKISNINRGISVAMWGALSKKSINLLNVIAAGIHGNLMEIYMGNI